MGQSKEVKQKWKGSKSFDICFSGVFNCHDQRLTSGSGTGHKAVPPTNFEISLIFPIFQRSRMLGNEEIWGKSKQKLSNTQSFTYSSEYWSKLYLLRNMSLKHWMNDVR